MQFSSFLLIRRDKASKGDRIKGYDFRDRFFSGGSSISSTKIGAKILLFSVKQFLRLVTIHPQCMLL